MWYKKSFSLPKNWDGKDVIIHFEAVDHHCSVWVNDILVGSHKGGFDRFSFNITPYLKLKGNQKVVLSVEDATNFSSQPRGKQQINASGKEFITQRNEYGVIQNFSLVNYDQSDFIYFTGINYKIKKNIYANIQYNWWGEDLNNSNNPTFNDFNYRRLLFIFSVKL